MQPTNLQSEYCKEIFKEITLNISLQYYKWEALISLLGEKEGKKHVGGKKRKEEKIRTFPRPRLELSSLMFSQLSNTVYQRIELT